LYERDLVPAIFAQWVDTLIDLAQVRPGDRVLDVGCGTGIVTRALPARVGPHGIVVGLDANPAMLAVARRLPTIVPPAIAWYEGNATLLPFPAACFDVVVAQQALQFIPDKAAALREMRRVLVPGGRLGLAVWRSTAHAPGWAILEAALARHVGAEAAQLPPFSLGDAEVLRRLVEAAGFHAVTLRSESKITRFASPEAFVRQSAASAPTMIGALAALGDAERQTMVDDAIQALRPYSDRDGLAFPQASHLVFAYA
jgi:SAM-dependent methyltransferase